MKTEKDEILQNLCYTELVYERIRKKLSIRLQNKEIEKFIFDAIKETPPEFFVKKGKNYYISSLKEKVRITVNSHTTRVITVDKIIA
jgi:hypothetical protein